jgi:hypothetical protein
LFQLSFFGKMRPRFGKTPRCGTDLPTLQAEPAYLLAIVQVSFVVTREMDR